MNNEPFVNSIVFTLENCEVLEINSRYIEYIDISKIDTKIKQFGKILKVHEINDFFIKIINAPEIKGYIDRLHQYNDITHIDLKYSDGTIEYYVMAWENDRNDNEYQSSIISEKSGNLYLSVERYSIIEETIKYYKGIIDMSDLDEKNDSEYENYSREELIDLINNLQKNGK